MKRKTISIEEARALLARMRDSDPDFRGTDLELAVKSHRRSIDASQVFVIAAAGALSRFPQYWMATTLVFVIFAIGAFYTGRQASRLDQVRQLFERNAPQNLDELLPSVENHA